MAASVVEVCNLALTHLGQRSIALITEATEQARKCNILFNPCRDAVLRLHPWNFATTVEALVEISGETVLGWDYLYQMPSLCLFARRVDTENTLANPIPQEFEVLLSPTTHVRAIASNLEDAYLRYTKTIADPSVWDSAFVVSLSYFLASKLALSLNGSADLAKEMHNNYLMSVDLAMRSNALENKSTPIQVESYIDVR